MKPCCSPLLESVWCCAFRCACPLANKHYCAGTAISTVGGSAAAATAVTGVMGSSVGAATIIGGFGAGGAYHVGGKMARRIGKSWLGCAV